MDMECKTENSVTELSKSAYCGNWQSFKNVSTYMVSFGPICRSFILKLRRYYGSAILSRKFLSLVIIKSIFLKEISYQNLAPQIPEPLAAEKSQQTSKVLFLPLI